MRSWMILSAILAISLHLGGCQAPSKATKTYHPLFFPSYYDEKDERVLGALFLKSLSLSECGFDFSTGVSRFVLAGRTMEVPFRSEDRRPVIPLRLVGPKGTIERNLLVSTMYSGPISISCRDAEELGIDRGGAEVVFESEDGSSREIRREASIRVEVPELGYSQELPATWAPAAPGGAQAQNR
jgi:hypothetical protein